MTKPADYNNLGHPATTPVGRPLRPGWLERHERYCAQAAAGLDLVFLGDSLTQRWETAPDVWREHYAQRRAAAMGIDNDGTQQVLWRIDHGTLRGANPRLVVLLIGVNNFGNDNASSSEVRDGIALILQRIRTHAPAARILLLGLLPYAYPGTDLGSTIHATNLLLAQLAPHTADDFLDLGPDLLVNGQVTPDHQPDGAHLSPKGYAIFARAIEPLVRPCLG